MKTALSANVEGLDAKELLKFLAAWKKGDFSGRLPMIGPGITGKVYDALNEVIETNQRMTHELERISRAVGKEGKINQRASVPNAAGGWAVQVDSVNSLISDLMQPSTEIARVITAVAKGDLTQTMPLEVDGRPLKGEFARTAKVVNTMVGQLNSFASEVTRVAREVGTEGKLGGQAEVQGVAGTWKDLTDSVNSMAVQPDRAGTQHRGGHHRGREWRPFPQDHRGRTGRNPRAEKHDQHDGRSAERIRNEVTRVAREVGTEGKLGGQAQVKGGAGVWKDLTDSVNFMAGESYVSGPEHRSGYYGHPARRSLDEDHGGCARRNPRAEEHHQHHGRSAQLVRG